MSRLVEFATLQDVLNYAPGFRSRRTPRGNRGRVQPKAGTSGGAAPFSPADVAGLLAWYDAQFTDDVTINTTPDPDTVSAWLDHHTTNEDTSEGTAGNQSEWQATGWGSTLPCLNFVSASQKRLVRTSSAAAATLSNDAAFTIYVVYEPNSASLSFGMLLNLNNNASSIPCIHVRHNGAGAGSNKLQILSRNDDNSVNLTITGTTAVAAGVKRLCSIVRTVPHVNSKIWLNGVDDTAAGTTDNSVVTMTLHQMNIGVNGFGAAPTSNPISAKIAAILLYSGAHDDSTRQQIEAYLQARWGTPALP